MPKVTYMGPSDAFSHHNNPSNRDILFHLNKAVEVSLEEAEHYAKEAEKGGPWVVDFGVKDKAAKAANTVREIIQPKPKRGGRKGR